jgi:hypothetical protein
MLGGLAGGLAATIRLEPAHATPERMRAAIRTVVGEASIRKGRVDLEVPPLVENGNTVSLAVSVDSPMTGNRLRQGHSCLQRKEPSAQCDFGPSRPARRQGEIFNPLSSCRLPDRHGHRRDERRQFLVRIGRCDRYAGGLRGGHLDGPSVDQCAGQGQARPGVRDQNLDFPHHGDGVSIHDNRRPDPARYRDDLLVQLQWRGNLQRQSLSSHFCQSVLTFSTVATESGTLDFKWTGDNGFAESATAKIVVE